MFPMHPDGGVPNLVYRYPEVQDCELARLRRDHISQDEVLRDIPKWLQALEDGTLPRGSVTLFSRVLTGTASQGKRGW